MEVNGKKAKGLDGHTLQQRRLGAEGQRVAGSEGAAEQRRGWAREPPGFGRPRRSGWVDAAEKREQVPTGRERERGEGNPGARPTPHIPPRRPASPSGRGQYVRSGRTCVRGAAGGNRRRAPRLQESEGPRAPLGAVRRLTRGLSCRRPPGPACAAAAERPRPGVAVSRRGSARRRSARRPGQASGRRARLPLPVSGPHCRG